MLYLFFAALTVQVLYLVLVFIGIFKKSTKNEKSAPVSVVVVARNEFANLQVLLPKLLEQDYQDFEVILVDDQSNDETEDWAREISSNNDRIVYIRINSTPDHIQAKKYGLTIGIKQARNPVILLTDADCYPSTDQWINEMASHYSGEKEMVLGFSGYETKKSFLNYFMRYETLLTGMQYLGWAGIGVPYMGVGRNLSYLKSFFLEKKGFKKYQHVTGGDDDLFVNQHASSSNTVIATGRNSLVLSKPKTTWKAYYRQKLRHLSVGKLYKRRHKLFLSLFTSTQFIFWISLIVLLLNQTELYLIGFGFLIRLMVLCLTLGIAGRRFGQPFNIAGVFLLDFCYIIYYIFVGTAALFSRKVKWS